MINMKQVTVSKVGRIIIPNAIRKQLSISEGTRFEVIVRGNTIELHDLRSKVKNALKESRKLLKSKNDSLVGTLIEMRRREAINEER